jgi:hypothetical protein
MRHASFDSLERLVDLGQRHQLHANEFGGVAQNETRVHGKGVKSRRDLPVSLTSLKRQ